MPENSGDAADLELTATEQDVVPVSKTNNKPPKYPASKPRSTNVDSGAKASNSKSVGNGKHGAATDSSKSMQASAGAEIVRYVETDITVYGATRFVARHVLNYIFNQVSIYNPSK